MIQLRAVVEVSALVTAALTVTNIVFSSSSFLQVSVKDLNHVIKAQWHTAALRNINS